MPIPQPKTMSRGSGGVTTSAKHKRRPTRVPKHTHGMRGQINTWMAEAFQKMGVPELAGQVPWNMSKRLTTTLGHAGCTWAEEKATKLFIEFSVSLMKASDEATRRQCVFHESAHICDYYLGTFISGQPHGSSWASLMIRAGVEPARCHKIEPTKRRRIKKYIARCSCKEWKISAQKRRQLKLGTLTLSCKQCGSSLTLER